MEYNDCYVYIIFDKNGLPLYVGSGRGNRWLHMGNDVPKVKIHRNLSRKTAFKYELALINAIGRKEDGGPLINGRQGVRELSPETKAKISAKLKGRSKPAKPPIRFYT